MLEALQMKDSSSSSYSNVGSSYLEYVDGISPTPSNGLRKLPSIFLDHPSKTQRYR